MNSVRSQLQEALDRFDQNPPEDYLIWRKKLKRQGNMFLAVFLGSVVIEYILLFLLVFRR